MKVQEVILRAMAGKLKWWDAVEIIGESDAVATAEIAKRYERNLKRLMDLVRAACRADDLPVGIGRIPDSGRDHDGRVWIHGEAVRQAKQSSRTSLRHVSPQMAFSRLKKPALRRQIRLRLSHGQQN